jgi:hypothetical protein
MARPPIQNQPPPAPQAPENGFWSKVKEAARQRITETLIGFGALVVVAAATATWALLKQWVVIPGLPSGAVVAFAKAPDVTDERCPSGWSVYGPARGRVIVGAGPTDGTWARVNSDPKNRIAITPRRVEETGGEETHLLDITELTSHQHISALGSNSIDGTEWKSYIGKPLKGIAGSGYGSFYNSYTSFEGGGHPFNLLQPYVALYFCRKD